MKELVSVVIPVTDPLLSATQEAVLEHCVKVLHKYSLIFVTSENADTGYLKERYSTIDRISFHEKYFKSDRSIDSLLLMDGFYERFNWCNFVLVHRLNSWIVKEELHYWCKQGYDFLNNDFPAGKDFWYDLRRMRGFSKVAIAAWDAMMPASGISLRHVERFTKVLKGKRQAAHNYRHDGNLLHADDLFWELETNRFFPELRKPTSIVSERFSRPVANIDLAISKQREELPFAVTGVTAENLKSLPYFD